MHNELKDLKFKGVENKKFQFMKSFKSFLECKTKSENLNDDSCSCLLNFSILKLGPYEVDVEVSHKLLYLILNQISHWLSQPVQPVPRIIQLITILKPPQSQEENNNLPTFDISIFFILMNQRLLYFYGDNDAFLLLYMQSLYTKVNVIYTLLKIKQ